MKSPLFYASLLTLTGAAIAVPVVTNQSATQLAQTLVGSGITVSNATYSGSGASNGVYTGSTVEAQGNGQLTNGIVLSSGSASILTSATNTSDNYSLATGSGSDADLQTLIPGSNIFDATSLEFDFVAEGTGFTTVSFWYVFGSEEYDEFVNSQYNDVFGFFLNGVNVALIPGTTTPVSINTVNGGYPLGTGASNPGLFVSNDISTGAPYATQMDGFTVPLYVQFDVLAGSTNHMKLAIGDAGDSQYDSWVLIGGGSFNNTPAVAAVPEPGSLAMMGLGLALIPMYLRRKNRASRKA
jgi:hypothetical protein